MGIELWLVGGIGLALGAAMPFGVRPLLHRAGAVDVPNERSSHMAPTLRGGGLATLIAWDVALLCALFMGIADVAQLGIVLAVTNLAALIGFVDDVVSLPAGLRLTLQLLIGLGVGVAASSLAGHHFWWALAGMLVVAGYVNVANFIDGINGISGVHGGVAGAAFLIAGIVSGHSWLAVSGIVLAAAFISFLPWNLRRPNLFLGDVGSYFLGSAVGAIAFLAIALGVSPLLVIPVAAPWLADTVTVVVRRFIRGEGVLTAHRTHAYQRLTDVGLSHGAVSIIAAVFSSVSAVIGLLTWHALVPIWLGLTIILVLSGIYLLLPHWLGATLPAPPNARLSSPIAVMPAQPAPGSRKRWAVFGASGFVGAAVVSHLRAHGYEVLEFSAPRLSFDVSARDGDLIQDAAKRDTTVDQIADQLSGVDVVVNAAGAASPNADATRELWGANAYLPVVLAHASRRAGVVRFIHLSSAAVQGRTRHLDETPRYAPFSPYSRSKALGELALLAVAVDASDQHAGIVIVRATSVQGPGRPTTQKLRRLASSRLASVAAPGNQPSVVSGLHGLTVTVEAVGVEQGSVSGIVLQPWEGLSVDQVLTLAGGHRPVRLPRWLCATVLAAGYLVGRAVPQFAGLARRLEMMWFGQSQDVGWASAKVKRDERWLPSVLASGEGQHV